MRTTIHLNDGLMKRVKALAARRGTTLTALMEESLRRLLSQYAEKKFEKLSDLVTVKGGTIAPGVDLNDTSALLDLMERET